MHVCVWVWWVFFVDLFALSDIDVCTICKIGYHKICKFQGLYCLKHTCCCFLRFSKTSACLCMLAFGLCLSSFVIHSFVLCFKNRFLLKIHYTHTHTYTHIPFSFPFLVLYFFYNFVCEFAGFLKPLLFDLFFRYCFQFNLVFLFWTQLCLLTI